MCWLFELNFNLCQREKFPHRGGSKKEKENQKLSQSNNIFTNIFFFVYRALIGLLIPTQRRTPCPHGQRKGLGLGSGWVQSFFHLLFIVFINFIFIWALHRSSFSGFMYFPFHPDMSWRTRRLLMNKPCPMQPLLHIHYILHENF